MFFCAHEDRNAEFFACRACKFNRLLMRANNVNNARGFLLRRGVRAIVKVRVDPDCPCFRRAGIRHSWSEVSADRCAVGTHFAECCKHFVQRRYDACIGAKIAT